MKDFCLRSQVEAAKICNRFLIQVHFCSSNSLHALLERSDHFYNIYGSEGSLLTKSKQRKILIAF